MIAKVPLKNPACFLPGCLQLWIFRTAVLAALLSCGFLTVPAYAKELPPRAAASSEPRSAAKLMERGKLSLRLGAFADAAANFEAATRLYGEEENRAGQCEALIFQAQAGNFTGRYTGTLEYLAEALRLGKGLNDRHQIATVLGLMGNAQIGLGKSDLALINLHEGLAMARESGYPDVEAAILNNLGNLYVSQQRYDEAISAYRDGAAQAEKANHPSLAAASVVNAASAAMRNARYADAGTLLENGAERLKRPEDSYAKASSLISAGLVYSDLRRHLPGQDNSLVARSCATLNDALAVAIRIDDQRTVSYAYGYLGKLYEDESQLPEALELTRRAIFAAQQTRATEALYKWHWQSGRILARLGKIDDALASYRLSIRDLQGVREEMSSCYASPESSYQKTAGVICLELVDLLLQRASKLQPNETMEPYLIEARETVESLKVFELREYFKDDCIDAARSVAKKLDLVSDRAVIVYPILLRDRVELLVSFSGKLKRFILPVGVEELTKEIRELRKKLVKRTTLEFLPHAQRLYDWIVRPLEKDLNAMPIDTLVFVPDGPLRTIPMAALHDGNQFLINRYPIAITPSLNLTDPRPINREHANLLSLGVTQPVQGFPGLPYVSDELDAIKALYGGKLLLNSQFQLSSLETELKKGPFSIVHIASHGHFGGSSEESYLLAFDEKFTMARLSEYVGLFRFRDEPLDLLTLSACETAAGDDRAALGLAGVAVRAGAKSALATLWHVNDPASYQLIAEFYRQLQNPAVSRAGALQAAQLKLLDDIRFDHPGYWAPFLLINNWL